MLHAVARVLYLRTVRTPSKVVWFVRYYLLLHVLARPNVGALDAGKDISLVSHNTLHHDVVEDGADDAAQHLGGECGLGRQVCKLCELEITREQLTLRQAVVTEDGEIHICERLARV